MKEKYFTCIIAINEQGFIYTQINTKTKKFCFPIVEEPNNTFDRMFITSALSNFVGTHNLPIGLNYKDIEFTYNKGDTKVIISYVVLSFEGNKNFASNLKSTCLPPYYAIEEAYNDVSKKYLSYYNRDNMQKDISDDTRKLFAKEFILNNIDYYKQIIDFIKYVIANKIKTGCLTSDEAAKSFILRNKKNPYIMKYRDFFTKEVIKAYEFYNID